MGSGVVSIAQHAVNDPHGLDLAAAEAICQATQSPFLADALLSARAALCCLTLTLPGAPVFSLLIKLVVTKLDTGGGL